MCRSGKPTGNSAKLERSAFAHYWPPYATSDGPVVNQKCRKFGLKILSILIYPIYIRLLRHAAESHSDDSAENPRFLETVARRVSNGTPTHLSPLNGWNGDCMVISDMGRKTDSGD